MSDRWGPIMDDERDVRTLPNSRFREKSVTYVERDKTDSYINNPEGRFTILPSRSSPPPSTQRYEQYPSRNERVYYEDPYAYRFDQDLRPQEIRISSAYNPRHTTDSYCPDALSYRYYDDVALSTDCLQTLVLYLIEGQIAEHLADRKSAADSNSDGDTEIYEFARRSSARRERHFILGHDEHDDLRGDMSRAEGSTSHRHRLQFQAE